MRFRLRYQQHNLELSPGQFLIGRSTECQLSLDDPLVSRKHARLVVTEDALFVEDLGSRNGVLVGGVKVEGKRKLDDGDRLTVGSQEMMVIDAARGDRASTGPSPGGAFVTYAGPMTATNLPVMRPVEVDEQSKKADAFRLLGGVADKALALGRAEEAERILASLLTQLLESARSGNKLQPEVLDQAGRYGARLAGATAKGTWVDYVIDLYALHQRVLPAPVVDELYAVMRKVGAVNLGAIRGYLGTLRDQAANLGPNERFLLQRIEGLERLAALKLRRPRRRGGRRCQCRSLAARASRRPGAPAWVTGASRRRRSARAARRGSARRQRRSRRPPRDRAPRRSARPARGAARQGWAPARGSARARRARGPGARSSRRGSARRSP